MRKLLLLLFLLVAWPALAQQPRVIIVTAGGDVGNTGTSLNVNCTGGCAAATDTVGASQTFTAAGQATSVALAGENGAVVLFTAAATPVLTLVAEVSADAGTTWTSAVFFDPVSGATQTSLVNPANGAWEIGYVGSQTNARVRASAFTSGSIVGQIRSTVTRPYVVSYGSDGTNLRVLSTTTGGVLNVALAANQSVNVAQWGGTATSLGQKVMASSVPVTIASDQSAVLASQSGTWTVQPGNTANTTPWLVTTAPSAAAAIASTVFYNQAVTTSQTIKASAGNIYGWNVYNPNSSVCFLQVFNTTTPTLGTTVPIFSIPVTNGIPNVAPPGGVALNNFGTAIAVASTTTAQGATTCTTGQVVDMWVQ